MMNLNDYTNEALYAGLTDGTLPEEALTALRDRLYPIIMNEAKPYFQKLSWNRDDALQEALILIWQTVAKKSFNPNIARGQYHDFFSKAWKNRMVSFYRKAIRQPVVLGTTRMGYTSTGEPVFVEGYGFDPKHEEYLARHREECKRSIAQLQRSFQPETRRRRQARAAAGEAAGRPDRGGEGGSAARTERQTAA